MDYRDNTVVRARMPLKLAEALDQLAAQWGMSRSAIIRDFVAQGCRSEDVWPPKLKKDDQ